MSFDDRVRRHLHAIGSSLEPGDGQLGAVRQRAQRRARQQQVLVSSLGVTTLVAALGAGVLLLSGGQGDSLEVVADGNAEVPVTVVVEDTPAGGSSGPAVGELPDHSAPPTVTGNQAEAAPDPDVDPESDNTEGSGVGAVVAATSTTISPAVVWTELASPVESALVDYWFGHEVLLAKTSDRWFADHGDGWAELPSLDPSLSFLAGTLDHESAPVVVATDQPGAVRCQRDLVLAVHGDGWQLAPIQLAHDPAVATTVVHAEVRATVLAEVVTLIEEFQLDPVCVLRAQGVDGTDASFDGGDIVFTEGDQSQRLALQDLGLSEDQLALIESPVLSRSVLWRHRGDEAWTVGTQGGVAGGDAGPDLAASPTGEILASVEGGVTSYPSLQGPPAAIADADGVIAVSGAVVGWNHDGPWVRWDGAEANKIDPSPVPAGTNSVVAAHFSNGEWVTVYRDGDATWLDGESEPMALASLSGKDAAWARLGNVGNDVRLIAETPVGLAVFARRSN